MIAGFAGIGFIGGSLARDYKKAGHTVYVEDRTKSVTEYAQLAGVSDGELNEITIPQCDIIFIAKFPEDTIEYMRNIAPNVSKKTVVMDCGGTKRIICKAGFQLAHQYGYTYVGGHPMAGTQYSGFKNSFSGLFAGQPMVIVPEFYDDINELQKIKDLLAPAKFGKITVTTSAKHDKTIAFTSQLAHVVSCAYIKSPTAQSHAGVSAGSYKDMTRVAHLNEKMWTQLFMENSDNLLYELNNLIGSLEQFRDAISDGDAEKLEVLLAEGRELKEKVDGKDG